jgi:hypothetical protein
MSNFGALDALIFRKFPKQASRSGTRSTVHHVAHRRIRVLIFSCLPLGRVSPESRHQQLHSAFKTAIHLRRKWLDSHPLPVVE